MSTDVEDEDWFTAYLDMRGHGKNKKIMKFLKSRRGQWFSLQDLDNKFGFSIDSVADYRLENSFLWMYKRERTEIEPEDISGEVRSAEDGDVFLCADYNFGNILAVVLFTLMFVSALGVLTALV